MLLAFLLSACSTASPQAVVIPVVSQGVIISTLPVSAADIQSGAQATQPQAQSASPTPECATPASLTPSVTEGPYFKAGSPERASLVSDGMPGTRLTLTGYVLTADCKPVAHALLDFWQADANGNYDNSGYTLRGHQYTNASGRYSLETVIPGLYPGRTEHIHVKAQAPGGPVLTTQLFFPGAAENQSDQIFNPALLIHVLANSASMQASFDFVINPR